MIQNVLHIIYSNDGAILKKKMCIIENCGLYNFMISPKINACKD